MSQFSSSWEKKKTAGLGERLRSAFNNPGPLKPRLDALMHQMQVVMAKLDTSMAKIRERDSALFAKTVAAVQKHENQRASMFANELAEVRKVGKMVTQSKLALEQIVLRLNTITELGDIVATLAPATSIVRNVKQDIVGVMPDAEGELGEVSSLLSGILVDAGSMGGYSLNFEVANEEAEMALSEAAAVAESRMKEKFPELPQPAEEEAESFETA
ncbi:MAG TPA: Snf7 family protein [Nitrososphaerales archaeon]|nr:Snf7 family protein [Nitrososphaerales archaeon]